MKRGIRSYSSSLVLVIVALTPLPLHGQERRLTVAELMTYEDDLFAAIARAAGIPDLRDMALPDGHREIRLREHLPMLCCQSAPFLRVSQSPATARADLLLFRRIPIGPGQPVLMQNERCEPLHEQRVCVQTVVLSAAAVAEIVSKLDELGAWTISDRCDVIVSPNGRRVVEPSLTDSGELHMHRAMGAGFTAYRCNAPSIRTSLAGQRANAIYRYFLSVAASTITSVSPPAK